MIVRCEFSDLPADQCQHCKTGIERTPDPHDVETVGQPITARFPGVCVGCGGTIEEGQRISRSAEGFGYVHVQAGGESRD